MLFHNEEIVSWSQFVFILVELGCISNNLWIHLDRDIIVNKHVVDTLCLSGGKGSLGKGLCYE